MIKYRESQVSAYHNYLVNDMLTPGFLVGDRDRSEGFYFLAHPLSPDESPARISGRLLNEKGLFLLELDSNQITENPGGCSLQSIPGGFRVMDSTDESLLEVRTHNFTNGLLTRIKAKLFDEHGDLRIEPLGESIQIHGTATLVLEKSSRNLP
jgi:Leucine-rich repeat (LRR) protein